MSLEPIKHAAQDVRAVTRLSNAVSFAWVHDHLRWNSPRQQRLVVGPSHGERAAAVLLGMEDQGRRRDVSVPARPIRSVLFLLFQPCLELEDLAHGIEGSVRRRREGRVLGLLE